MAIESTVITGDHATGYSADAPCLAASTRGTAGRWNADGNPATADASDAAYPATAAYDGNYSTITRMAAGATRWYVLTLPSSTVDCISVHVHDAGLAGGATYAEMTAYLSDSEATPTDLEITGITSARARFDGNPQRLFVPRLQISGDTGDTARRFTGAVYLKLKFVADAGTCRPQLSECHAGRARQMQRRYLYPDNERALVGNNRLHTATSGLVTRYQVHGGLIRLDERFALTSSTEADEMASWFEDTSHGLHKTIWCPRPKSAPDTYALINMDTDALNLPRQHVGQWDFRLQGLEDGGFPRSSE